MQSRPGAGDANRSYALVSFISGPLGSYLDRMRRELVASGNVHSHVTILPPRPLAAGTDDVRRLAGEALDGCTPLAVALAEVEVFESTSVVYLAISSGKTEVERLHDRLNQGALASPEVHLYHPHVTLAQDFPPQERAGIVEMAKARWAEFSGPRTFEIERLTFLLNTVNCWRDVASFPLSAGTPAA